MTSDRSRTKGRRYHLKRVLGEGAFGRVYLAEQESEGGFKRLVALKVLHSNVARRAEAGQRMRDEARVLGQLQHRNIVAVLDLVNLSNRWAIVMDYVPGVDLEALVAKGPVPPAAAVAIGAGVARALDAAGRATDAEGRALEVVHRDIKPSNVRLTDDGEIKVLDFGVARFSLDSRESQTRGAGWVGTERYMAPERILGQGDLPAGDVYALGATVYELLMGEPLGRSPALPNQHATLVDEAMARLAMLGPSGPSAWSDALAVLADMLAADPEARPEASRVAERWTQSAADLPGESVIQFAARAVPVLMTASANTGDTAEGILEEGRDDALTYIDPADSFGSEDRQRPAWVVGGVLAAMLVGGLGVAAFAMAGLIALDVVTLPAGTPFTATVDEPATAPEPVAPATAHEWVPPEPAGPPMPEEDPHEPVVQPAPAPSPVKATARPEPRPAPPAPTVEKALFSLKNASGIWVRCGDREARGTSSARIASFAAGPCEVRANYLGNDYRSVVEVTAPRTVQCRVDGEEMSCS